MIFEKKQMVRLGAVAGLVVAMAGCSGSGSGSGSSSSEGGIGDIDISPGSWEPNASLQQKATLDQNKTKNAMNLAYSHFDGVYINMRSLRAPGLRSNTLPGTNSAPRRLSAIRLAYYGRSPIPFGDNIPCDSGTYSAKADYSQESTNNGDNGKNISKGKMSLSFNNCVLKNEGDNKDIVEYFDQQIQSALYYRDSLDDWTFYEGKTFVFNGSFLNKGAYEHSWADTKSLTNRNKKENTENAYTWHGVFAFDNISTVVKDANGTIVLEEKINIKKKSKGKSKKKESYSHTYTSKASYDNGDGNYTKTYKREEVNDREELIDGTYSFKIIGDTNITYTMNAIQNYYKSHNEEKESGHSVDINGSRKDYQSDENGSNKVFVDGENSYSYTEGNITKALAQFASGLELEWKNGNTRIRRDGNFTRTKYATLKINGEIGSNLIGGSTVIKTDKEWKSANPLPENRLSRSNNPLYIHYGNDIRRLYMNGKPYIGKTTLSGANKAEIEFGVKDDNSTYGSIKIDDEDPVEYTTLWSMFGTTETR